MKDNTRRLKLFSEQNQPLLGLFNAIFYNNKGIIT